MRPGPLSERQERYRQAGLELHRLMELVHAAALDDPLEDPGDVELTAAERLVLAWSPARVLAVLTHAVNVLRRHAPSARGWADRPAGYCLGCGLDGSGAPRLLWSECPEVDAVLVAYEPVSG